MAFSEDQSEMKMNSPFRLTKPLSPGDRSQSHIPVEDAAKSLTDHGVRFFPLPCPVPLSCPVFIPKEVTPHAAFPISHPHRNSFR